MALKPWQASELSLDFKAQNALLHLRTLVIGPGECKVRMYIFMHIHKHLVDANVGRGLIRTTVIAVIILDCGAEVGFPEWVLLPADSDSEPGRR